MRSRAAIVLSSFLFGVAVESRAQSIPLGPNELTQVGQLIANDTGFGRVCDASLLQEPSGSTAIVSVDYSGRHFCNELLRVRLGERPTILQRFDTHNVDDLSAVLLDVDRDGTVELAIPHAFSTYEGGTKCQAVVPVVYACNARTCGQVSSSRTRAFYAGRISDIERDLASPGETDAESGRAACLAIERDKIVRVLGDDPQAGLARAEEWMKATDPFLRRRAADVFADINDSRSRGRLRQLATDPDTLVARLARTYLER